MTSAAVTAATTPLPRPRAIDGAVENDISNRTLIVRRPKHIAGYEAFMWRQAHEALALYEERGGYVDTPWCGYGANRRLVPATPGENLTLRFSFSGWHGGWEGLYGVGFATWSNCGRGR